MRRPNVFCWGAGFVLAVTIALPSAADEATQTVDAGGLTFQAPKSWKSSPPTSRMRRAQLTAQPAEGDDYPAELVVYSFGGAAGSVEANLKRWQMQFKDEDGGSPKIESKTVKGKNVDVVRAETHGEYHPPRFPGRPVEPVRKDARMLAAIVSTDGGTYYIRMIGPDKTMTKLRDDFDEMLKSIKAGG